MLFASLVLPCDVCMAGVQHSYLMIIQCSLLRRFTVRRHGQYNEVMNHRRTVVM